MSEIINIPQLSNTALSLLGISVVLCVLLPLIAVIYSFIKVKKSGKSFFYGFAAYLVAQLVIIPVLANLFLSIADFGSAYENGSFLISSLLALLIAILEEGTRYICFAYLLKSYRDWNSGYMFGLGYGCTGMMISGGMSAFNDLVTATAINSGAVAELDAVSQQTFAEIAASMAELPSLAFLMTGIDQFCIAAMSVALSILLMEAVAANNNRMLGVTVMIRMMSLFFPLLLTGIWYWGFIIASLFLAMIAGVSIWYTVKTKKPDPGKPNFRII